MAARNSYPKGARKRDEILREVLEVMSRVGYERASMKELAAAVGLSVAGLQHHFATKDELYTAVLAERDEIDRERYKEPAVEKTPQAFTAGIAHNREVAGLVELYVRFSAEATAADHPAHEYFATRLQNLREQLREGIARAQDAGDIRSDIDPAIAVRTLVALSDGAQLHWLLTGDDMAELIEFYFGLLKA